MKQEVIILTASGSDTIKQVQILFDEYRTQFITILSVAQNNKFLDTHKKCDGTIS